MALCLHLPPGWKACVSENEIYYTCSTEQVKGIQEHPRDIYVSKLLCYLRVRKILAPSTLPAIRIMTFCDQLLRPFEYELRGQNFVLTKKPAANTLSQDELLQYDKLFKRGSTLMPNLEKSKKAVRNEVQVKDLRQVFNIAKQAGLEMKRSVSFLGIVTDIVLEKDIKGSEWTYKEASDGIFLREYLTIR